MGPLVCPMACVIYGSLTPKEHTEEKQPQVLCIRYHLHRAFLHLNVEYSCQEIGKATGRHERRGGWRLH